MFVPFHERETEQTTWCFYLCIWTNRLIDMDFVDKEYGVLLSDFPSEFFYFYSSKGQSPWFHSTKCTKTILTVRCRAYWPFVILLARLNIDSIFVSSEAFCSHLFLSFWCCAGFGYKCPVLRIERNIPLFVPLISPLSMPSEAVNRHDFNRCGW